MWTTTTSNGSNNHNHNHNHNHNNNSTKGRWIHRRPRTTTFLGYSSRIFWVEVAVVLLLSTIVDATASAADSDSTAIIIPQPPPILQCDPCIARSDYTLQAIFHGERTDPFWLQVVAAAQQMAQDLNIRLTVTLYDNFDPNQMAADIQAVADLPMDSPQRPNALIVSIPATVVEQAIANVIQQARIPVFGCNSGYKVAVTPHHGLGLIGFVAQDEYLAGVEAAKEILRHRTSSNSSSSTTSGEERILFINHEQGNTAISDRYQGFATTIQAATGILVDEVVVDGQLDDTILTEHVRPLFTGCPYSVVQVANARVLELALAAFDGFLADCTGKSVLGTFDSSKAVYDGIVQGKVVVGVSQQNYLQGAIPVLLATLFVTTGQALQPPSQQQQQKIKRRNDSDESSSSSSESESDFQIFLSGPSILNLANVPTDTMKVCADDAFPICPNTKALIFGDDDDDDDDENRDSPCPCTDRRKIRIGGVLHGVVKDTYWDVIFAALQQSALDMGITLELMDRLEKDSYAAEEEDETDVTSIMANQINTYCNDNVDGIIVSIPHIWNLVGNDDTFVKALLHCNALRVPIISINSGAVAMPSPRATAVMRNGSNTTTETNSSAALFADLMIHHHIGQDEYQAGYMAGQELLKAGVSKGWCLNHFVTNQAVSSRCTGMQAAFDDENKEDDDDDEANGTVQFMGTIKVPLADDSTYLTTVEAAIADSDATTTTTTTWEGVGLLLLGPTQVTAAMTLKSQHTSVSIGTFDVNDEIYAHLDSKQLLFAIDQHAMLQGALPIPLLTILEYSQTKLKTLHLETGPTILYESPRADVQTCQAALYSYCERTEIRYDDIGTSKSAGTSIRGTLGRMALRWWCLFGLIFWWFLSVLV
jgi:ABC-type sugar transport system substrate-binding protein